MNTYKIASEWGLKEIHAHTVRIDVSGRLVLKNRIPGDDLRWFTVAIFEKGHWSYFEQISEEPHDTRYPQDS